jgi:hypothetical protein
VPTVAIVSAEFAESSERPEEAPGAKKRLKENKGIKFTIKF